MDLKLKSIRSRRSIKGVVNRMWHHLKDRSIKKSWKFIDKDDFTKFALNSCELKFIYEKWVLSRFDKKISPSVDRINNSIGYVLDNIQFLTHSDNVKKGNTETKAGKIAANVKRVKVSKDMNVVEFKSQRESAKFLSIEEPSISMAIKNGTTIKGWKIERF